MISLLFNGDASITSCEKLQLPEDQQRRHPSEDDKWLEFGNAIRSASNSSSTLTWSAS